MKPNNKFIAVLILFIYLNFIYITISVDNLSNYRFIDYPFINYNSAPLSYGEIEWKEDIIPTLLDPFRSPKYAYTLKGNEDIYLVEQFSNWRRTIYTILSLFQINDFLNSNKSTVVFGPENHLELYGSNLPDNSFHRSQGGGIEYPNALFFILYYLSVIILIRYIQTIRKSNVKNNIL